MVSSLYRCVQRRVLTERGRATVCASVTAAVLCLQLTAASAAAPLCVGDCNGTGEVTVDEILLSVNIALGNESIEQCQAVDVNGDGQVTVDELIGAVRQALQGCEVPPTASPTPFDALTITGRCRKPGPGGLVACDAGTVVTAWRCDDRNACPDHVEARTRLGDGPTDVHGAFSIAAARSLAEGALLLMDAPVDNATVYRTMDFGPAAGGRAAAARALPVLEVMIDPSAEAGVRLLDENGVANFSDEGIRNVLVAARAANETTTFDDLSPAAGADLATTVARNDPNVQQVIQQSKFTPTPGETPTVTPTPTLTRTPEPTLIPTLTATPTPGETPTVTPTPTLTRTPEPTLVPTLTATPTPTRTPTETTPTLTATSTPTSSRTPTSTRTPTVTQTATPTRTGTRTPTSTTTRTSTRTATNTPSSTPTRTHTSTATSTPTRTNTRTATNTPTSTPTRTATPTATNTPTRTSTRTPTSTPTVTPTRTITPTPTVTPTSAPVLLAQITTDRGCLENGNNAVYAVGEALRIFYRVDGQIGGQPITQAQVTITDIPSSGQATVVLSGSRPAGQTNILDTQVSPPTGTESLVLQAQAPGFPQTAQDQCSFQVVQAAGCQTACDCPTEQRCNMQQMCENGPTPIYCCSQGPCPAGAMCQDPGLVGQFFNCPMP